MGGKTGRERKNVGPICGVVRCFCGAYIHFGKGEHSRDASRVVPIDKFSVVITMVLAFVFLHETVDWKTILGGLLITAGTLVMVQ